MPKGVDTRFDGRRKPEYPRPATGGGMGKPPRKPPTKTGGTPNSDDPSKKNPYDKSWDKNHQYPDDPNDKMRWNGY